MRTLFNETVLGALVITLLWGNNDLHAGAGSLSATVPKTAYLEWLPNSTDPMTAVNGDNTATFVDYAGGPLTQLNQPVNKKTYIGVMCNSLAGYDIVMTASNSGATAGGGNMTTAGGQDLTFSCTFTKVSASFTAGTTAAASLDLTGATPSGTTSHTAEADLPMTAAAPNVWELDWGLPVITSVSDGLILAGTYAGGVTVTIVLK